MKCMKFINKGEIGMAKFVIKLQREDGKIRGVEIIGVGSSEEAIKTLKMFNRKEKRGTGTPLYDFRKVKILDVIKTTQCFMWG
jgi:hypothetical protein